MNICQKLNIRGASLDCVVVTATFFTVFVLSLLFMKEWGFSDFYQLSYSPAVTLACKGEMQFLYVPPPEASGTDIRALSEFLYRKADVLDCRKLPSDRQLHGLAISEGPLYRLQRGTFYLIYLAGMIWSITGVTWSALFVVSSFLAGLFSITIYGIFRLVFNVRWAVLGTTLAVTSPIQISMLPNLRDYSKAPFIVGFIFICGYLLTVTNCWRQRYGAAALAGCVTGIGLGFRADLWLNVPFFLVTLGLLAFRITRREMRKLALLALLFLAAFTVAALPILLAYQSGGALGHVLLLGWTEPFNTPLQIEPSVYDIGGYYNDSAIADFVRAFASRFTDGAMSIPFVEKDYDFYSMKAWIELIVNFPADFIIRVYSSIIQILSVNLPAADTTSLFPHVFFMIRKTFMLFSFGPFIFILALCIISANRPLLATFLLLACTYFSGLGALQFSKRHVFHLEFLYWLAWIFLLSTVVRLISHRGLRQEIERLATLRGRLFGLTWGVALRAALPLAFIAIAVLTLALARVYQQAHLTTMFAQYWQAQGRQVELAEERSGDLIALQPTGEMVDMRGNVTPLQKRTSDAFYLVAVIDTRRCGGQRFDLTVRYQADSAYNDHSRTLTIPSHSPAEEWRLFFPVPHWLNGNGKIIRSFTRLEMPAKQRDCFQRLESVTNYRDLPFPLWLRLGADWHDDRLFQTLNRSVLPQLHLQRLAHRIASGMAAAGR